MAWQHPLYTKAGGIMGRSHMEKKEQPKRPGLRLVFVSAVMYAVTMAMLFVLAFVMYQMKLPAKTAEIVILFIYIAAGLTGGILMGGYMGEHRLLWGLAAGAVYFVIFVILALALNGGMISDGAGLLLSGGLCLGSAMAGGMVAPVHETEKRYRARAPFAK